MKIENTYMELPIKLPKEPKDFDRVINDQIIQQAFLIYNSKEHRAVCTHCGELFNIGKEYNGRHSAYDNCPKCKKRVKIQSEGYDRSYFGEFHRLMLFTRKGKTVYATLYFISAKYEGFSKADITKEIMDVWVIDHKKQTHYNHLAGYWPGTTKQWRQDDDMRLLYPGGNYPVKIYWKNIKEVFEKTDLKYLNNPQILNSIYPDTLLKYMSDGMKYQAIELMSKGGFIDIVRERLNGGRCGACNWRGKHLEQIMRLSTGDIRKLRDLRPTNDELYVYQRLTESERNKLPWLAVKELATRSCTLEDINKKLNFIRSIAPLDKWWEYITTQNSMTPENERRYYGRWNCMHDWEDYIEFAKKLGMDMNNKQVYFPSNLRVAHDEAAARVQVEADKIRNELIKKNSRAVKFSKGSLTIISADSQTLLNEESAALSHCVRTYGDRIANGRCYIFLIRRAEDKKTPYYTLETDTKGNFVQCRGDHNCGMTDEVKGFVDDFVKYLKNLIKKEGTKCQTAA